MMLLTIDVLVSTEETALVVAIIEESVVKLTLNRRLLIRGRTPEKSVLFIALLMSVLGTIEPETTKPGEKAVSD